MQKNDTPIDINNLPNYGFAFFFKNMQGYKAKFIALTAISILSTLVGFGATWLLSFIISHIEIITVENILTVFLPIYLVLVLTDQYFGYLTRRYGERLPVNYTNHLKLRFFSAFLRYQSNQFINYSKEKLFNLSDKYIGYTNHFLSDWNWGAPRHITRLGIIVGILWYQSPIILLINVVYMAGFIALSIFFSKKFVKPVRAYHEKDNSAEEIRQNFIINLNAVKKLQKNKFFVEFYEKYIALTDAHMLPVRKVHSFRWLLQMNLFNLVFIFTFFYAIYQVTTGALHIGFLLLIQYAFNNLLGILIYFVEYHAILLNQKQDNMIFKEEIKSLGLKRFYEIEVENATDNSGIVLRDVNVEFENSEGKYKKIEYCNPYLANPIFRVYRRDKIVITGESGSGKSTLFNILLDQIEFNGSKDDLLLKKYSYINSTDPLFNMPIAENIILDQPSRILKLDAICKGLTIDSFINPEERFTKVIGHGNFNLSTGQTQRIKLARLLYNEADIYLMDEPFNGIDDENKQQIITFINEYLKDKAIILITHDEIPYGYIHYAFEGNKLVKQTT